MNDAPEFYAKTRAEWRQWLKSNHVKEQSVWLIFDKGKDRTLEYEEIVLEALCFGWVDSIGRSVDDKRTKLYISRRKTKSVWAKTNKARIERLAAEGLMTDAGWAVVKVAKENGMWEALDKSDNLEKPQELETALKSNPKANEFYEAMPAPSKRIILEWIYAAKTDKTREQRINQTVTLAEKHIKAYPNSPKE
ncbi:MAG: YdeI/OmpD-associated family protein [Candidatus Saccharibacteria bacterium]|nr:YdeI/OmpD-associated family protein [Candidatus Saccharibacteria bacterium]